MNPSQLKIMERLLDYLPEEKHWSVSYDVCRQRIRVTWNETGLILIVIHIGKKGVINLTEVVSGFGKTTPHKADYAWQKLRALRKNRYALKALEA